MPDSKNLPSSMCPSCAYYEFHRDSSNPHRCKHPGSFTNADKCGQDPNTSGTAGTCRIFKSN